MSDELNAEFEQFEMPEEAFPFTIEIKDKDGNIVDTHRVEEPGILTIDSRFYPPENGPYTSNIVMDNKEFYDSYVGKASLWGNNVNIANHGFYDEWINSGR